jgi:hypothetical protein
MKIIMEIGGLKFEDSDLSVLKMFVVKCSTKLVFERMKVTPFGGKGRWQATRQKQGTHQSVRYRGSERPEYSSTLPITPRLNKIEDGDAKAKPVKYTLVSRPKQTAHASHLQWILHAPTNTNRFTSPWGRIPLPRRMATLLKSENVITNRLREKK